MDAQELKERQSWSLAQKIDHSLGVIDQFRSRLDGKVFVSFSGGKDSTVLLDLCRVIDKDIKAVYCNTGNEWPDIVRFVRGLKGQGYNIEIIRPQITPKEVMEKCGFPLLSKELSCIVDKVRNAPDTLVARRARGEVECGWKSCTVPKKYGFLVSEDFNVSDKCCYYLKKKPMRLYVSRTGLHPIIGTMACESQLRRTTYLRRGGCNTFTGKIESMPLSIWMEEDIWEYIRQRDLPIADIYVKGAHRTGCMFCGFGCQYDGEERFALLKSLYPKWYDTFMDYTNNGVTYREALRKVLAVGNLSLPDENVQLSNRQGYGY
jgi:3'-phosphoadenosine 5'-phosphosulfate sulfotransferase (PAPS reductase)/FAD synthetase